MENLILTYFLIKVFFDTDEDQDYVDTFIPFVLNVLNKDCISFDKIQTAIESEYYLKIPLHTLRTIIKRARNKGYVESNFRTFEAKINDKGIAFLDKQVPLRNIERQLNEFYEFSTQYINNNFDISISPELFENQLSSLIKSNILLFSKYSIESYKIDSIETKVEIEKAILGLCTYVEANNQHYFDLLKDIIIGSIISLAVFQNDISKTIQKPTGKIRLVLDSNLIFRLQKLDPEYFSQPTIELFKILDKRNFELFVFDFTIQEMISVISSYLKEKNKYSSNIQVDSIYWELKNRGWEKSDVINYIQRCETDLQENYGIKVIKTGYKLKDLDSNDFPLYEELRKYKPENNEASLIHDLLAINLIKRERGGVVRDLENSKIIFLTSDYRLTKFNLEKENHNKDYSFAEVILENTLTNILWLKNPTTIHNIPISMILHSYSRSLSVEKRIWDKFIKILSTLVEEKKIKEEDVSILLYSSQFIQDLTTIESDELTEEWTIESVRTIAERSNKEKHELVATVINQDKRIQTQQSMIAKKIEEFSIMRKNLWDSSNWISWIIMLIALIALIIYIVPIIYSNWDRLKDDIEPLSILIGSVIAIFLGLLRIIPKKDLPEKINFYKFFHGLLRDFIFNFLCKVRNIDFLQDFSNDQ